MDHLEHPCSEVWETRRHWFENITDNENYPGGHLVSDHACALIADIQSVFCSGAWVAVIVLCMAVIEIQLRDIEALGFKGNSKKLLNYLGWNNVQWLRKRKNELLHGSREAEVLTVDELWTDRATLKIEARQAVETMVKVFYGSPSV